MRHHHLIALVLLGAGLTGCTAVTVSEEEKATATSTASEITEGMNEVFAAQPDVLDARHQLTLTFTTSATVASTEDVEAAWRSDERLLGVYRMDADDVEDETGFPVSAMVAWTDAEDARAIACGYADEPGVAMVGVDDEPCETNPDLDLGDLADNPDPLIDDSGASLAEIELAVGFSPTATPAQIEPIRRRLERSDVFTTFEFEFRQSEFDGASIDATGDTDDVEQICRLGIQAMAEFPVVQVVQLFGSNACPSL